MIKKSQGKILGPLFPSCTRTDTPLLQNLQIVYIVHTRNSKSSGAKCVTSFGNFSVCRVKIEPRLFLNKMLCHQVDACVLVILLAVLTSSTYALPQEVSLNTTPTCVMFAFKYLYNGHVITQHNLSRIFFLRLFCLFSKEKENSIALIKISTLYLFPNSQSTKISNIQDWQQYLCNICAKYSDYT